MYKRIQGHFLTLSIQDLKQLSKASRISALNMANRSRSSHIGSALSCIDILVILYLAKKTQEESKSRSKIDIVCSKGHAAMAVYSVLAELNEISKTQLNQYCSDGQLLYGHVDHKVHDWIPLTTGSLGHGLPFGIGMALAYANRGLERHVFVLISDGELNEGTTWECALIANALSLSNITILIDYNKIQSFGRTEEVLPLEPILEKWKSFGWETHQVDGHNFVEIQETLSNLSNRSVLVLDTIKGKGVSFMEDKLEWHYKSPSELELIKALAEVNSEDSNL